MAQWTRKAWIRKRWARRAALPLSLALSSAFSLAALAAAPGASTTPPDQRWVQEKADGARNTTPMLLLENTFQAIDAEDTVSLARTMRSMAGRERLSEVDALDAHRQFTWGSALAGWQKLRQAFAQRHFQLQESGNRAQMRLDMGGTLGMCELEMVCVDGNWYFADL